MATDEDFIRFVAEQISPAGRVRYRKMFGEYALYLDEKVIALVCDNQLFLKPTGAGKTLLGDSITYAPPYPGAKPYFLLEFLEDGDFLAEVAQATARELPPPKPKKRKSA